MIYKRVKTNLANTLDSMEQEKARYDDYAKLLLSDPQVLANIIKAIVPEFEHMPVSEIVKCIGEVEVTLSFPELLMIKLDNSGVEDIDAESGKIIYDIKFMLYYKGEERIYVVNLEAQKSSDSSKLGYELKNRMVYYICRMVSSQKGTEFIRSSYDDIKKVYSIWICMDAKEGEESIIKYSMNPELIYGSPENIWDIELLNGAVINISTDNEATYKENKNKLISMLELLFSSTDVNKKDMELENKFGIKMTTELKGVAIDMCNVSDLIEERGIKRGRLDSMVLIITKKIKKNKPLSEIASDLEQDEAEIRPIYEAVLKAAPDYDVDHIIGMLDTKIEI